MRLNRRQLVQSLAAAPLVAAPSALFAASPAPLAPAKLRPAIAAIAAYAELHRRTMGVPGLTIGLTTPEWLAVRIKGDRETKRWIFHFTIRDGRWIIRDWVPIEDKRPSAPVPGAGR